MTSRCSLFLTPAVFSRHRAAVSSLVIRSSLSQPFHYGGVVGLHQQQTRCASSQITEASDRGEQRTDMMKDYASAHITKKRRGSKRKKQVPRVKRPEPNVDKILANVFEEVMASRDRGEKVMEADVQQKAYEKTHEAVMGRKAFSKDDKWRQSLPREPLQTLRRLRPCTVRPVTDVMTGAAFVSPEDYRTGSDHDGNGNGTDSSLQEKYSTPSSSETSKPEETNNNSDDDDGSLLSLAETVPVFLDAVDELAYWETQLYEFLRDHPARLRKTLPLLMEQYTVLAHRLKDAMLQYVARRNAVAKSKLRTTASSSPSPVTMTQEHYTISEQYLQFPRDTIVETGKSLSGTYDPTKFTKSATGKLIRFDAEAFKEWRQQRRAQQRSLTEAFSSLL